MPWRAGLWEDEKNPCDIKIISVQAAATDWKIKTPTGTERKKKKMEVIVVDIT